MLFFRGPSSLLVRLLAVLVAIAIVLSLWMYHSLNPDLISNVKSWINTSFEPYSSSNMSLSSFFPVFDSPKIDPVARENSKMLHALVTCMEQKNCHQNQTKVVILGASSFRGYLEGTRGGEAIWAHSTGLALTNMGYTVIYIPSPSLTHAPRFYSMFPDLVKLVIMDASDASSCYNDRHNCRVSDINPTGIPPWKVFSFHFWPGPANPLGLNWTLSPEDYYTLESLAKTKYLGYSIEEACHRHRFVPHNEREDQAWVLAKHLHYFTPKYKPVWSRADFDAVTAATGLKFAMASFGNDNPENEPEIPSTSINYGRVNQTVFMEHLSKSRVVVGIGNPALSPSPYDSLCLGIPFINPIMDWDRDNPTNSSRWNTQHNALRAHRPPYVYNVFKGDTKGFVQAVKDALANPIDSYVPPRMKISAVEERLGAILETDWKHEADLLDIDH